MAGTGRAPSRQAVPNGLAPSHNGLGPERVIEIQRGRLLSAIIEVAAERGAGNVTVAHVVERAGVSRRTFYELFSDREECFLGAFDDGIARVSRHVLDAYDSDAGWAERIRTALTGLLQFLDVERGAGQLLVVGSLGAGASALERRQRVLAQMTTLIDEGRGETKAGSELPPLTAEGIVGGVLSVLHSRLLEDRPGPLVELTAPLMSMIVLPYLGPAAARKELARSAPHSPGRSNHARRDPLRELGMRLTYRTVRVLMAVAANPGGSNRQVADGSGIADQGQISKLLARLHGLDLVENAGAGSVRGGPNAWTLTVKGSEVERAITQQATHA
jgi:AcrR family transcriptional regulator